MKKFIISVICALTSTFFATTAIAASGTADASVTCEKGDSKVARAVGENAKVTASCGAKVKKPVAKSAASSSNAAAVSALAHENANLKASASATASVKMQNQSIGQFPEEGKVYADAEGNTFERHKGGSRECKFYVNGELVKRQFVQHSDPHESKKQCDLLSQEFYATLTPTTPEKETSYSGRSAAVTTSQGGNHLCEFKVDGKVTETQKVENDPACKAWTLAKAKEKGLVAK